ncbi:hypothetical protein phiO18_17 [Aeromonas phage phiO18P]|uniref:Uncharacterized protein n=1 Tax=Aeromonas phage phiO18P TaxID=2913974 RepID=A5X9G8_9CAUD|nr:hypothetical protein phiO18_17 [Aeromonas phage phiO18P]ABG73169.1 hypothetical protein phiO18_17 [Aeromonas phage phiO18P]
MPRALRLIFLIQPCLKAGNLCQRSLREPCGEAFHKPIKSGRAVTIGSSIVLTTNGKPCWLWHQRHKGKKDDPSHASRSSRLDRQL